MVILHALLMAGVVELCLFVRTHFFKNIFVIMEILLYIDWFNIC